MTIASGWRCLLLLGGISMIAATNRADAQPLGEPDRGAPGDFMIQEYLAREALRLDSQFDDDVATLATWESRRPRYHQEYLEMLGLWPLLPRTPLQATVTGTITGEGYTIELLHYQSAPGLYVTGNLYRPARVTRGEKLPAILYVCGHSPRGRDGNKTAFQSHGMWFARHGYVCLVIDTLQLGEIAGLHHGTYREGRWWWHSRGYTPAGVECWNGVRGIDYLVSRPDVDAQRIGVTGISGGGAATFWIAAADERVRASAPVSGMADLESYVGNRVINGHCDCMFLHNAYQWPWTRIAGLIAPRPLLFVNSDRDGIFPMDANARVIERLERLYSRYGADDAVDAVVSVGGHAYRQDIRQAVYRFFNMHFKNDPRPVTDSEVDLVTDDSRNPRHPIEPQRLRVFPTDNDVPADALNMLIDELFVPLVELGDPPARVPTELPQRLRDGLRKLAFHSIPATIPAAKPIDASSLGTRLETEPGMEVEIRYAADSVPTGARRVLLVVRQEDEAAATPAWVATVARPEDFVVVCDVRGVSGTRWTHKDPPNYIERSHVLVGQTVDTGRVRDVAATAAFLRRDPRLPQSPALPVHVAGKGRAALWAAYAAVLEPGIAGAILVDPPTTHTASDAPQFLNILRVADVPPLLGLVAPRPLSLVGAAPQDFRWTAALYIAAGAEKQLTIQPRR